MLFAGAAFAVLQILQQAIGPFDPKPVLTALIAAAVGLGGLALDRWRLLAQQRRERDAKLQAALRAWPLPRVGDANPLDLGVFPQNPTASTAGPDAETYIVRTVDKPLRRALEPGSFALVFGPARSGKSRTAHEAARARMSDCTVIVPANCEALHLLLEVGLPLGAGGKPAILWLDGLERYVDAIDSEVLADLCEGDDSLAVVATIRTDEWTGLLTSAGQRGEAAKAIAARARAFEVLDRLDDDERERAQAVYPQLDFAAGVGRTLAASGMDQEPSVTAWRPANERGIRPPEPSIWNDQVLFGAAGCSLLAALAFFATWIGTGFSCLPIAAQVGDIKQEGARGGRGVKLSKVDFHGTEEASYLLVFRDKRIFRDPQASVFRRNFGSDELRIYDRDGDKLVRRFRFQPTGKTALYGPQFVGDFDGDGAEEVVAAYGRPTDNGQARIPFALDWDEANQRYKFISLQPKRPHLAPLEVGQNRPIEVAARKAYEEKATLRAASYRSHGLLAMSRRAPLKLSGHRVHNLAVTGAPRRLLLAYLFESENNEEGPKLEVRSFAFDQTAGEPRPMPCRLTGLGVRRLQVNVEAGAAPEFALGEAWEALTKRRKCIPEGPDKAKPLAGAPPGPWLPPLLWPPKERAVLVAIAPKSVRAARVFAVDAQVRSRRGIPRGTCFFYRASANADPPFKSLGHAQTNRGRCRLRVRLGEGERRRAGQSAAEIRFWVHFLPERGKDPWSEAQDWSRWVRVRAAP